VGEQIVEAGRVVACEQDPRRAVFHVTDVLPRDDEATVRVQGDPPNAMALGHDRVDRPVGSPPVHTAIRHVTEIQIAGPVDARPLDQPVPLGERPELNWGSIGLFPPFLEPRARDVRRYLVNSMGWPQASPPAL